MLTQRQYQILNVCADNWEVFLYLYLATGSPSGVSHRDPPESSGNTLVSDVCDLVQAGLLSCRSVARDGGRAGRSRATRFDMSMYQAYSCDTLHEHVTQFGNGPHEFKASQLGVRELGQPKYRAYDRAPGWGGGKPKSWVT